LPIDGLELPVILASGDMTVEELRPAPGRPSAALGGVEADEQLEGPKGGQSNPLITD
jgi:hypothetical protein